MTDLHTVEAPVVVVAVRTLSDGRDEPPVERRGPRRVVRLNATTRAICHASSEDGPPVGRTQSVATLRREDHWRTERNGRPRALRPGRDRLHQAQRQQNTKVVMFTSAMPGEGKSLTAANVALTLSLYGRRVVLVVADLHKPTVHELFHVSNAKGLLDGLAAGSDKLMPVIEVAPNLFVLPAGHSTAEPMSP